LVECLQMTDKITDKEIAEVLELWEKVAPEEWAVVYKTNVMAGKRSIASCGGYNSTEEDAYEQNESNAQFIAKAPQMAAMIKQLREEKKEQEERADRYRDYVHGKDKECQQAEGLYRLKATDKEIFQVATDIEKLPFDGCKDAAGIIRQLQKEKSDQWDDLENAFDKIKIARQVLERISEHWGDAGEYMAIAEYGLANLSGGNGDE